jgi:hypothetical protein
MGEGGTIGAPSRQLQTQLVTQVSRRNIGITELPITPNYLYKRMYQ